MPTAPRPNKPPEFVTQAQRLVAAGRIREALTLLERVLAQHPDSPVALHAAATILVDLGASERAIALVDRLRSAAPNAAATHLLAARAEEVLRRYDDAAVSLERAHTLRPDNPAPAALRARLAERSNDLQTARRWVDTARAIDPDHPLTRLLDGKLAARGGEHARAGQLLFALSSDPAAMALFPPMMRAAVFNELGQTLDRAGSFADALAAFEASARERVHDPAWRNADAGVAIGRVGAARRVLSPGFLGACTAPGVGERCGVVFLVGVPRSGTTLTERVLGSHPRVVPTDEQTPLGVVITDLRTKHPGDYPGCLASLPDAEGARLRRLYRDESVRLLGDRAGQPGTIVLDKLPLNLVELPLIARVFGDARLIMALRDPRDVCLSNTMQLMAPNPSMKALSTLEGAAEFTASLLGLWCQARPHLRMAWTESRYEGLVRDPGRAAEELLAFCGLEWNDAVLDAGARSVGFIGTPSYEAVSEEINTRAIERWRHYKDHIGAERWSGIERTLAPALEALGYGPA